MLCDRNNGKKSQDFNIINKNCVKYLIMISKKDFLAFTNSTMEIICYTKWYSIYFVKLNSVFLLLLFIIPNVKLITFKHNYDIFFCLL